MKNNFSVERETLQAIIEHCEQNLEAWQHIHIQSTEYPE